MNGLINCGDDGGGCGDGDGGIGNCSKRLKMMPEEEKDSIVASTSTAAEDRADGVEKLKASSADTLSLYNEAAAIFAEQYALVKHTMEYLDVGSLLKAGLVKKSWLNISNTVRKQRKNSPYTILLHPYLPHHKLAIEYFNGVQVSEAAKNLVEKGKDGYHPYKPKSSPSPYHVLAGQFTNLVENSGNAMRKAMANAYDEPQLIVSFGTSSFETHLHLTNTKSEKCSDRTSKQRMNVLLGGIQKSIPCLSSFSCGVIANVPESSNKALEMEKGKFPCLSSMCIPKVDGFNVQPFAITKLQSRQLKGNETAEKCKKLLGIDDSNEDRLKGIMLFHQTTNRNFPVVTAVLNYLQSNPDVALAGGMHTTVLMSGVADNSLVATGALIFGNDRVRVSSVALRDRRMSDNNRKKLDDLKASVSADETNLAFMFACNGRGRGMYRSLNVESDLFNTLFPNTPLIGAFTYGEFCHENMTISTKQEGKVSPSPPERIDFSYTTVFLLISYKHPPEAERDARNKQPDNLIC